MEIEKIIGLRVKYLRAKRKITLRQLVEMSGCHMSNISRVEAGQGSVTVGVLEKILHTLGAKIKIVEEDEEDEARFYLQESTDMPAWWAVTDAKNGIVVRFKEHNFYKLQKVTDLDDKPITDIMLASKIIREIGEWMANEHIELCV